MSGDPINQRSMTILRLTLGVGATGKRRGYRNRYVAKAGSAEQSICADLVEVGLMRVAASDGTVNRDEVAYCATQTGREMIAAQLPRNRQPMPAMPIMLRA